MKAWEGVIAHLLQKEWSGQTGFRWRPITG
nr:MAG TPA: hypothetical protein [Caudoviricetes sp.]